MNPAAQPQHFLNQVAFRFHLGAAGGCRRRARGIKPGRLIERDRLRHVIAPGRHRHRHLHSVAGLHREAQAFERGHRLIGRHRGTAEAAEAFEAQAGRALPCGRLAGLGHLARLATTKLDHHGGRQIERDRRQRLIDAAFEALARIGADVVAAARAGDAHRVEDRAFDEALGRRLVAAGWLAADDAAQRFRPGSVGDDAVLLAQRIGLAVQRQQRLTRPGHAQGQRPALHLRHVEDVQRPAEAEGEVVGYIDQRVDGAKADRRQQVLQPLRGGAVLHPADGATQHPAAGVRVGDLPGQRCRIGGGDCRPIQRLQPAEPGGGEVAGDAMHAQRIAAIGRDADLNDRIVEPGPADIALPDRGGLRQIDDARMIVAEAHLPRREHHRLRRHAADFALLQGDAGAGDEGAGQRQHAQHPRPRIGRAADDRQQLPIAGIDLQRPQPIGVGVLHRLHHAGDAKAAKGGGAILHPLDFEADAVERGEEIVERGVALEVSGEPAAGELHLTPPRPGKAGPAGWSPSAAASGYRCRRRGAGPACRVSAW